MTNNKQTVFTAVAALIFVTGAISGSKFIAWKESVETTIAEQAATIEKQTKELKDKQETIAQKDAQITDLGGKVDTLATDKQKAEQAASSAKASAATANKNLATAKQENENLQSWIYFLAELSDNLNNQRGDLRQTMYYMHLALEAYLDENYDLMQQYITTGQFYGNRANSYDAAIDAAISQLESL